MAIKKRLRFIHDTALGYLLAITHGIWEPTNSEYQFTFNISYPSAVTSLTDINSIIKVTTTTSRVTEEKYNDLLMQKQLYAELAKERGFRNSHFPNTEKEEYLKNLTLKHKQYETPLSENELTELNKLYPEIYNTIVYLIKIPKKNLGKLKQFIKRYVKEYENKELDMQERLLLPSIYTEWILSKINDPVYISKHGPKRLLLESTLHDEINPYFFHSLILLEFNGKISINNITVYSTLMGTVEIDNLTKDEAKVTNQPISEPYWQDDFIWQGNKFVFGTYGSIDFDSPDRESLFRKLTNAKGHWVKVSELKGGKDYSFVRPTINQIENRFKPELKKYASIPSKEDDNMPGKPEGHGAYRIKFSPKP